VNNTWDRDVDVLVVGTGAAGLTAAITAAAWGSRTLVVESMPEWGGSTAGGGGEAWLPTNPLSRQAGRDGPPKDGSPVAGPPAAGPPKGDSPKGDSPEKALAYLAAVVGDAGPASSPERRRAFVLTAPEAFTFLADLGVRWTLNRDHPDFYPDRVGGMTGRAVEVRPFDPRDLGPWASNGRLDAVFPLPVRADDVRLIARAAANRDELVRGARVLGRTAWDLARGRHLVSGGAALSASLMTIVLSQCTEVLLSTPLRGFELDRDRRAVTGAILAGPDGRLIRVRVRRGIVLAAGGFARNTSWRLKYHGIPGYSSAADGDTGDVIALAEDIGARLTLMEDAWWGASLALPDGYAFSVFERSLPFSIMVDADGSRFVNESASSVDVGRAMLADRNANPSWLVTDARHHHRYRNSATSGGEGRLRAAGLAHSAGTVEDLAIAIEVDPARLRATVARFNAFARAGVDRDFGRGNNVSDNYYGDPLVGPNPNLGPLEKAPYSAFLMVPGDRGTKGGLLTDTDGRVLDLDGQSITGLYAAGNTAASVMGPADPGPGSAVGAAIVFGYRAARHAAARDR